MGWSGEAGKKVSDKRSGARLWRSPAAAGTDEASVLRLGSATAALRQFSLTL